MDILDQHIFIAEACGWKKEITSYGFCWTAPTSPLHFAKSPETLPNYTSSLDWCAIFESKLSEQSPGKDKNGDSLPSEKARYRMELCVICFMNGGPIHATAKQRCEAFIKVKQTS